MNLGTAPIPRADAVRAITGHLLDRDAFAITAGPDRMADLGIALHGIPGAVCYIDTAIGEVLRTDQPAALAIIGALAPATVVATVPKTVPATRLGEALGRPIPATGEQDVIILQSESGLTCWPMLFVQALDIADPRAAATIRAGDMAAAS